MNEVKRAAFSFENFRIQQFSLHDTDYTNESLNVQFDPSGIYQSSTGLFIMTLLFRGVLADKPEVEILTAKLNAFFRFSNDTPKTLEELPGYFYKNAIAIVFPYLRSFISTLTLQANIQPIILPVYNLSALEQPFREQTVLEAKAEE